MVTEVGSWSKTEVRYLPSILRVETDINRLRLGPLPWCQVEVTLQFPSPFHAGGRRRVNTEGGTRSL